MNWRRNVTPQFTRWRIEGLAQRGVSTMELNQRNGAGQQSR